MEKTLPEIWKNAVDFVQFSHLFLSINLWLNGHFSVHDLKELSQIFAHFFMHLTQVNL